MGSGMNFLFPFCFLIFIKNSHGCTMEGVSVWQLPITVRIEDYHDGMVFQRTIANVGGFTLTSSTELNGGPYITAAIEDASFVLRTNDAYRLYEENETVDQISLSYTFSCTNGVTLPSPLTIIIEINDNNNNAPMFKTPDTAASADTTYEFTIAPPVPPGFLITNCISDIIVRDIDLTTYRIDFTIEDNPYIAIEYDGSTDAKEYKAVLRTTSFIRSIPEPITLTISATDVDQTGDPAITTSTTVTIYGSSEFEMPIEPVFSQSFYLASYTDDNQITMEQPIALQQGYDDQVQFSLEGDYATDHFAISVTGNSVILSVTSALPTDTLQETQIYLVVNAAREYTSGSSATIVVQLPEAVDLEFERPHYEGEIVDNTLQLTQLILSHGYQGVDINVTVEDYATFFTTTLVGNIITLSMAPLDDSIIQENNFINLRVIASSASSSATAIVTLEILKDDGTTPAFERSLYSGTYDPSTGLTIDSILLVQGYDETVTVSFSGDYENYFELTRDGPSSTLQVSGSLPSYILSQSHLLLAVRATKPRTVGASAVVSITLPGARELQFEAQSYRGSLQDNILQLDTIILSVGYDDDVTFSLSGDYSSSFDISNMQNQVTINLPAQLPQEVISENDFLMLTLNANGLYALPTTTAVFVEIIKDDTSTPVFSQPIYYGSYLGSSSIDIATINLIQGYDSSVTYRIQGENSEYFGITQNENSATLTVQSNIPEEVVLREKTFVFNIFADKPLTVGANAAIVIKFSEDLTEPTIMQFASNTYTGALENNTLTLESIVLETGFAIGTQFLLSGDYETSFTHTVTDNVVTLSMASELTTEVLENNKFIVLELEARRDRAVSAFTGIIIDLVKEEIVVPIFSQAFYSGIYAEENTLQFQETINLMQGFDETVTFGLEGESATWFAVVQNGNSATIVSTSAIPQDVLDSYHQLLFTIVATKPGAVNGHAAISIELPKDILEREVLRFDQSSYEGQLNGSELQVPIINLSNDIIENVTMVLSGAYSTYFSVNRETNIVNIELTNELPLEVISNNEFIVIDIIASKPNAVSGYTALVLSIVKESTIVTPVFEEPYYRGELTEQGDLVFEQTMRLIQGFDESVSFTLSGDGSERFILIETGQNSLSLSIAEGGLQQIQNISHIVFSVVATKSGSVSGQAAIVIYNADSSPARTLRFSQNYYRGSLEENLLMMESISIVDGYSPDVEVTLSGDFAEYFMLLDQDGTYILQLSSNIPNEIIESNNILINSLEAYIDDARTHATVIVELMKNNTNETEPLAFDEAYYIGSYSATSGVMADIQVPVVSGYDNTAVFTLVGVDDVWFNIQHAESIVTLSLIAPLPVELFIDNRPVIFALNGINSAGSTSTATIIIALEGALLDITVLGFERNNYLGTIENNTSTLDAIVLTQGYGPAVQFTLQGDLSNYFTVIQQDSTLNVVLQSAIPEQVIPTNRIIVLDLHATAAQATSATTTIVFEIVTGEELSFDATFYVGQYSETEGLLFDSIITLELGYAEDVQFALTGEQAQWFNLEVQGNAISLITPAPISPAILANNHQLILSVTAQRPNSNMATATIVISLVDNYTDIMLLGFERASYLGAIENDVLIIEPIVLNEGYTDSVIFTLHGELSPYFNLRQQNSTVEVVLQSVIPELVLPANGIVLLELQASAPQTISATTTIVIETQRTVAVEELAFNAAHYIGQYSETEGLTFDTTISLSVGYDETVQFALEGEQAQWFSLHVQDSAATLTTSSAIPPAILVNNHQLVFSVTAQKPNSNIATATVVISIVDDYTDAVLLGFEQASYLGAIVNDVLSIEPIVLSEGYTDAVTFTLHGELASYFNLQQQSSTVNIVAVSAIPEDVLPTNGIVLLELRASAPQAITATTTLVIETQRAVAEEELAFNAAHYIGQYSETEGLTFDTTISLSVGYDETVQFALEGEQAQWFSLQVQGNTATLTTSGAIPPAVLVNNHQLVFSVTAQKPNSNIATATVVISIVDDYTDAVLLGFEQASYLGAIINDVLSIEPIVLSEGYTDTVTFTLHGELASYFNLQQQSSTVNIVAVSAIPEDVLPTNGIVLLELRASAPQAITATTTLVIETQRAVAEEELAFNAAHYIGQYSETEGLTFDTTISLSVGYDETVQFALEGEQAQWFSLQVQGNTATLTTSGAIPPAVLVNNHQLVFSVTAQKPNSNIATATVVISIVDDYTDAVLLGFEQASYLGAIINDVLSIEPIVLSEGYTDTVTFTLHGELASYFNLQQQSSTVNIVAVSAIPEDVLPTNGIVLLELRASAPQAITATTTLVIETQRAVAEEELAFNAAHYIGQYSETEGLTFDTTISLSVGYDETVQFDLEGEQAQWFSLQVQGNTATLTTSGAIPPAVLVNNHQLVFSVTAQKPNSNIATATVVISIVDDYTDAVFLGFEQASYLGAIINDVLSIEPIVLSEGYTDTVTFTLHGELASYFNLQQQSSTVNIVAVSAIPEEVLPTNGIVLLELRASAPQAITATTTLVLETQRAVAEEELAFNAAHYIGQYSETEGLTFDTTISLSVGYDETVQFDLEGEQAQWFSLQVQGNTATLTTSGAIPPAVLVNNHQLVFSVTAQKPNSNIATATVVISIVDDYTDAVLLGFEQASYLGAIINDVLSIEPIVLSEGYTDTVTFTLHGELASYFNLQQQSSTVNIVAVSAIPEEVLPTNGIVLLELRASAPQAITATTTLVIETQRAVAEEELAFNAAHYIGQYSETEGLTFDTTISLSVGYDETVQFALQGEQAQWFSLQVQGSTATLTTSGAIPPAVLVNNHQLVFSVTAQKPNSNIATATVVISIVDDYTDALFLGFEQASYLGAIINDVLSIEPIVLSEGYTDTVTFTLHGELASYFNLQQQSSTVNIVVVSAIPEEVLPTNGIVLLELRASAPQAITATTTLVIETQRAVAEEELAFNAAHYIGQYSETEGLTFDTTISLSVGYDETVQFALQGEQAQWFSLQVQGNTATLTTSGAIPPAVLVNNHQLVFSVTAQKPNSNIATATVVISIVDDYTDAVLLGFEQASYLGAIINDVLSIEPIVLSEGYTDTVTFTLHGELASYFNLQQQSSTVNIVAVSAIPEDVLPTNGIVLLELRASAPQAITATTTLVIETQRAVAEEELAFNAAHYIGQYSETEGLTFDTTISLSVGYDETVQFALEGEQAQWFSLQVQGNTATLTTSGAIPPEVLVNNHQLVFSVTAQKPNSNIATATVVISIVDDYTDAVFLGFEQASYLGAIINDVLSIEPIVLSEGYTDAVTFTLHGELASYFNHQQQSSTVNIVALSAIPEEALPTNGLVLLELRASAPQAIAATTTLVIEAQRATAVEELAFNAAHYIGQYSETEGLTFDTTISLSVGYDETVQFALEGEQAQWFSLQVQGNTATLTTSGAIPPAILVNNHQLVFSVSAQKPNSNIATATIVISIVDDYTDAILLGFEQASYVGAIVNDVLNMEPIILNEGYTDAVTFTLHGDLAAYFNLQQQSSTVNIVVVNAIPEEALPTNGIVLLELRASAPQAIAATTTLVIEAQRAVVMAELAFSATYYIGQYSETDGLAFDTPISLSIGYNQDVIFELEGEFAQWFGLSANGNSVAVVIVEPIPSAILFDVRKVIMTVKASKREHTASTIVVLSVIDSSGSGTSEAFDKVLYEGTINLNIVQHEPITITGYTGDDIEVFGVYRELFSASVSGDTVSVGASGTMALPEGTSHVALELRAGGASAVLVFDVIDSETPESPTVTFGSESYVLRAEMAQTGLVGQLSASASNGENIAYSLTVDDAHLQERISINSAGAIHLSAPTNTGVYSFEAIATSTITQVRATALVQLTVEATAICGDDHTLHPLIILDRDEEEAHANLVVLDSESIAAGCQFRLTNRWPLDQDWLLVDNTGLHARAIDREDPRIAFMALSQVQVELVLECANDPQSRIKRSTTNPRLDWLGPYEYGSNKWILTDTILHNSRRSFVNLIVNDINDNYPIFVGKENEPIVCGYPIPELEELILPRALAELKATDADVGENAALVYWSSSEVLAVAPSTGSVHVRDGASLSQDQLLTVSVTDLNGSEDGLTGTIELMVKLIDTSHIAVVTVRNAFLDQEETIVGNLSSAVGYEVKVLSSAVISDDPADSANARHKRDVTAEGASLQLYVYGVIDREPVAVDQLTNDITSSVLAGVDVTSTVSLEDYLEGREIYGSGGRDTGLLVATIVLSVLLFILIVAIAIWFFLRWKKARNYEQFSDAASIASRNEPLEAPPKLEIDSLRKPRLNIEELKRSERRLQEMLEAPVNGVTPKPQTSQAKPEDAFDTIINIAPTDTTMPIVIQSIDKLKDDTDSADEDEFGETPKKNRRKSVVTFNENVEKIIHVEDIPDDNSSLVEVFRF